MASKSVGSRTSLPLFVLCNLLAWETGELSDIIDEYTTVFRKSGKRAVAMAPACAQFLKDCGERTRPTTSGEARKACKIHDRCWGDCESVEGKCEDSPDERTHVTKQEIGTGTQLDIQASTWRGNLLLSTYCRTFYDKPFGKRFHKQYAEGRQKAGGRLTKKQPLWKPSLRIPDKAPTRTTTERCQISRTCVLPNGHERSCASLTTPQFAVLKEPTVSGGDFSNRSDGQRGAAR